MDEMAARLERSVGLGGLVDDGWAEMVESRNAARVLGSFGGDQRRRMGDAASKVEEEQEQALGHRRRTESKRHGRTVLGRRKH